MTFLHFFLFLWDIFGILDLDPDPIDQNLYSFLYFFLTSTVLQHLPRSFVSLRGVPRFWTLDLPARTANWTMSLRAPRYISPVQEDEENPDVRDGGDWEHAGPGPGGRRLQHSGLSSHESPEAEFSITWLQSWDSQMSVSLQSWDSQMCFSLQI